MVSGSWFPVHRPCGSPLGMRLEQSFFQIAANGSLEPNLADFLPCSERLSCQ